MVDGSVASQRVRRSIHSRVRMCRSAFPFNHEEYPPLVCRIHWKSLCRSLQTSLHLASSPPRSSLPTVLVA